jgi:hypothetical protein
MLDNSLFLTKTASVDTSRFIILIFCCPKNFDQSEFVFHLSFVCYWLNWLLFSVPMVVGESVTIIERRLVSHLLSFKGYRKNPPVLVD